MHHHIVVPETFRLFTSLRLAVGSCLVIASLASAASPASDNACLVPPYDTAGSWDGRNGGFGFGPWLVIPDVNSGVSGAFIGNANANGGGGLPGINCGSGLAWGLYANSGAEIIALRPFTGGPLIPGQRLAISMDNGYIDGPYAANNVVEFQLLNGEGEMRFGFHFRGGASEYQVFDASSGSFERGTGIPFTDGGLRIAFTLDGTDAYTVRIVHLANAATTTLSGTLGGAPGTPIESLLLVHRNAGPGLVSDSFFNDLEITCNGQPPTPAAASDSPRCAGQDLHLSASAVPGATYAWTGPDGFLASEQNPVVHGVTAADAGTYRVRATLNGCTSDEGSTTVAVNPVPAPPAPYSDSPVCAGETLHLFANVTADAYIWSGPDGFTSVERNPAIPAASTAAAGTYNLVVEIDGCVSPMGSTVVDILSPQLVPPPDVTVECGAAIEPEVLGAAVVMGSCGGTPAITFADHIAQGLCPTVATITRTWTATPAAGPAIHATQIITVTHGGGPELFGVPDDATVSCDAVPPPPQVSAFDACALLQRVPTNGLVLHYAFDENTGPVALDTSGRGNNGVISNASFVADGFLGGARYFDGNGDFIRVRNAPDLNSPTFTVTAWARALDASTTRGLFGKHQASVDDHFYWVYLDGGSIHGQMSGVWSASPIVIPDHSLLTTWTMVTMTYDGTTMRFYLNDQLRGEREVIGHGGNTLDLLIGAGEYGFSYTLGGGHPNWWWRGFIDEVRAYNIALSQAEIRQLYIGESGGVAFTETASGGCPQVITRTWEAEDSCGNRTASSQVLQVVDTEPPQLFGVPADLALQCKAEIPPVPYVYATDNCTADVAVHFEEDEEYLGATLRLVRRWSAADACGNATIIEQTIVAHDTVPPELDGVPEDVTVEPDAIPAPAAVTASDDCGLGEDPPPADGLVLLFDFDHGPGPIALDGSGHGQTGLIHQAAYTPDGHRGGAYYFDGVDDYIRVPMNTCLRATQFTVSVWARSLDETVTVPARGLIGKHRAGQDADSCWVFQDASGLHAQLWANGPDSHILTDDDPLYNRWAHVVMSYDGVKHRLYVDGVLVGENELYGYASNDLDLLIGAGEYTYHGGFPNWSWHGYIDEVRVYDHAMPPAEVAHLHEDTVARPVVIPVTFAETTNSGFPTVLTRTWTAADAGGNITVRTQLVTLIDRSAPVLSGQGEDATIECPAEPEFKAPSVYAPCDPDAVLVFEDATLPGECPELFRVTRTWVAIDACGHTSAPVSQTITVVDTAAPVIEINQAPEVTAQCGALPEPALATIRDDCDGFVANKSFSETTTPGSCPGSYTITRIWSATDGCGNSAAVTQVVTVVDTIAPVLSGQGEDATIECPALPAFTAPAVFDACDDAAVLSFTDSVTPGPCAGCRSVTRTWVATDACGNMSAPVSQTISIVDTTAPVITCPASQVVAQPACDSGVAFALATATDACDADVTVTHTPAPGTLLGPGVHTVTATASDDCGNTSTCSFTLAVLPRLRVVFDGGPVRDDNIDDPIETDADIANTFKSGSRVPHKVKLFDCAGNDVTIALASQVTVKLNVTQRQVGNGGTSVLVNDVPENYTGVGSAGGIMVLTDGTFHYNLNTTGYPAGTARGQTFFRSHITVEYKTAPGTIAGEEDATLESK